MHEMDDSSDAQAPVSYIRSTPAPAIAKVMEMMGWHPDVHIPMANEENLSILKELQELTEQRNELADHEDITRLRCEKLVTHIHSTDDALKHNMALLHAYQSDVRDEYHLFQVAEREHSKLKDDSKNLDKETAGLEKFVESTEQELCKRKKSIDAMTARIKWAKTTLQEWTEAMEDGNKGTKLIEKYFQEDQQLARQKDQRRQFLTKEIEKNRVELVRMYDEQKTLEQNLECTATLYRQAHMERRQMVETWKLAVNQMSQRERDIQQGELQLIELERKAKKKNEERQSYDNKLNEIINNNRETEAAIDEMNSENAGIKEQILILAEMIYLKEYEVEGLQRELVTLSNKVQNQRVENRQNVKEKTNKLAELENFDLVLQKLEERHSALENKNMNAQDRLQMLEEMIDTETKIQEEINKETTHINGLIYRSQIQLSKMLDTNKTLEVSNENIIATIAAIKKDMRNAEKDLKHQTQVHYEMSFKCLNLERRIIYLQGGNIDPEVEQRNLAHLAELEQQQLAVNKRLQLIELQNTKLTDSMRQLTIVLNVDRKRLEDIHFKIKEAQSYCAGGVTRLKAETQINQVLIVDLSILKMRANEFETEISKCEDSTYNLKKHRLHLNLTIKDRMVEIKSQLELLQLKRKHLCEEKGTLRADIGERNKHIDAVRSRFELTTKLLGCNEDGSLVTATQLRVESAQEKQMLLNEGNELNERVMKAESEIKALENTLMMMNNWNNDYRMQTRAGKEGNVIDELKDLQKVYCSALDELKAVRTEILQMDMNNENESKYLENMEQRLESITQQRLENKEILEKLNKELLDQKVKIQRADREIKTALKNLKQRAISEDCLALYDRDFELRELENRVGKVLNQLADITLTDDLMGPRVLKIMIEKGLKMPNQLQKSRSFISWRSDISETTYSSRDLQQSVTSQSSTSHDSHMRVSATQINVVSIDFPNEK